MAANVKEFPIYQTILSEALASKWLPILFFLNAFLTGFLLPTDYYEAGFNSHHWDFIYAATGAALILIFRMVFKRPNKAQLAISAIFTGIIAAFTPYLWAWVVLPNGVPDSYGSKWIYAFNGPVGQIVIFALLVGAVKYGRYVSDSVVENRLALNHLRSNMKSQIDAEQSEILSELKMKLQPALESVEVALISGAERSEITSGINHVINEVVRPLSHEIDASADQVTVEVNRSLIKKEFRKNRLRRRFKREIPLNLAIAGPLTFFVYINFNLSVISYLHGIDVAFQIGAPFLGITFALLLFTRKLVGNAESKTYKVLLLSIAISLFQALSFFTILNLFNIKNIDGENFSFALSIFTLTLSPAVFGMIIHNMRLDLRQEHELTNEIAHDLSTARRQLWAIRKKFAREIHGGLQAKLQVLVLQLAKNLESHPKIIGEFYQEFENSLLVSDMELPPANLDLYLAELTEFWSGVVTISWSISDEALISVAEDYLLQECIQEVIRESVNNAIKHGKADQVAINISTSESRTIELTVTNNVKSSQPVTDAKESLGTSIFKDLSKSWELVLGNNETTLLAEFAVN